MAGLLSLISIRCFGVWDDDIGYQETIFEAEQGTIFILLHIFFPIQEIITLVLMNGYLSQRPACSADLYGPVNDERWGKFEQLMNCQSVPKLKETYKRRNSPAHFYIPTQLLSLPVPPEPIFVF
jgi:hypothetical protein